MLAYVRTVYMRKAIRALANPGGGGEPGRGPMIFFTPKTLSHFYMANTGLK